jgi:ketosteroid isomerase-like protein
MTSMSPNAPQVPSGPQRTPGEDHDAVLAANREFYRAFEVADLDAMSDVWAHSDEVSCVHPGWEALHGWAKVSASWMALFSGGQSLQFILTDEHVVVAADTAWVSLEEHLVPSDLASGHPGGTVAALNVFIRSDGAWKMVAHHGSGIASRPDPNL